MPGGVSARTADSSQWRPRPVADVGRRQVATWEKSRSTTGGTLVWDGRRYQVRASLMGGTASMNAPGGGQVATAHDVGRKRWTIESHGSSCEFRRAAPWRQEETLHRQGRTVGSVRRTGILRGDAAADLPGLPLPVALFTLTLVLTTWDAAAW